MNSSQAGSVLKMEVQILAALENKPHVTKLIASGKKEKFTYMVMTLLGDSINNLLKKIGSNLTVSSQVRIGINILFGLKQIHDIGYIHRDLKPANVAQGTKGSPEERFFLILDFGLARQFVVTEANGAIVMRRPRERALFRGTTRYCSLAMHERADQGRVDDLWALVYMMAEFRRPLPWADNTDKNEVADLKRQTPDDVLLSRSPKEILQIAAYLRTLNYYDHPDYVKIVTFLKKIMADGNFKWSDPYHWECSKKGASSIVRPSRQSRKKLSAESRSPSGSIAVAPVNTSKKSFNLFGVKRSSQKGSREEAKQQSGRNNPVALSPGAGQGENGEEEYFKVSDFAGNPLGL